MVLLISYFASKSLNCYISLNFQYYDLQACENLDISISDLLHYPLDNEAGTSTPKTNCSLTIIDTINTSSSQSCNPPLTLTIPAENQIDAYVCI